MSYREIFIDLYIDLVIFIYLKKLKRGFSVGEMLRNPDSKLLWYEVQNFMSVEYAKVSFAGSSVLNFKGYNDSGKSALLRALDVLFYNRSSNQQGNFIKSGADFFKITACFSDGVELVRERYRGGSGIYEMRRGGKVIYSNKENDVTSKITCVPGVIQEYLGLLKTNDWYINTRSCFEKALLVETTGGENYRSLSEVMLFEELSLGGIMLNADKNALGHTLDARKLELQMYERDLAGLGGVTGELVSWLNERDTEYSCVETRVAELNLLLKKENEKDGIQIPPELSKINLLQLRDLINVCKTAADLEKVTVMPAVNKIDISRLTLLLGLTRAFLDIKAESEKETAFDIKLDVMQKELKELAEQLGAEGVDYAVCDRCGNFMDLRVAGKS